MLRAARFSNPSLLKEHGLLEAAALFAARFDKIVQERVVDDPDGDLEITDIHGYADHSPAFHRDGFGLPYLFSCVSKYREMIRATAVGCIWVSQDGRACGELHVGEGDDLVTVGGSVQEVVETLAVAAFDELMREWDPWYLGAEDDGLRCKWM